MQQEQQPQPQPLMGTAELAAYCGVSKQVICNWKKRGKLPPPTVTLAMGPIWRTEHIHKWWRRGDVEAQRHN